MTIFILSFIVCSTDFQLSPFFVLFIFPLISVATLTITTNFLFTFLFLFSIIPESLEFDWNFYLKYDVFADSIRICFL